MRKLVGDDFFRGMAGAYVAGEKPQTPVLIGYGASFADFIARFPPAEAIPYLADVARLENAWVEAYHSADAAPLDLAALGCDRARGARRPDIQASSGGAAAALRRIPPPRSGRRRRARRPRRPRSGRAEAALVTRPEAEVAVRILPPGGFAFAAALCSGGATLGEAAALCAGEGFDPGAHLVGLIAAGALRSFD